MLRRRSHGSDERVAGQPTSTEARLPFNAAEVNWVSISAPEFFFEPHCAEFKPPGPGQLIVVMGDDSTRHRGVEVSMDENVASVWVPTGGSRLLVPGPPRERAPRRSVGVTSQAA